jgi:polyphenol oxidase
LASIAQFAGICYNSWDQKTRAIVENDQGKLEWLEFDQLEKYPHVVHGVFARHGGVSIGPFAALNISQEIGDHPDSVKVNRERISKALDAGFIVFPHQKHGADIVRVTKKNFSSVLQADALFTTEKNIALAISHADCQAAIIYDPAHEMIAVAHVGWRGSVQNLYAKLIEALKNEIGSKPKDLLVCISPSLGPCHAEFKNYKQELPEGFWAFQTKPHYFDFWAISRMQLTAAGIPDKNIEIAEVCSYCTPKDYYSYRREAKTGRNATVVVLKG